MEMTKPGWLVYQGRPLTQVGKVDVKYASNDMPVETILLGLEGFSDGPSEVNIDFDNAIPAQGREADFADVCITHRTVDFIFKLGGVAMQATGRVMTVGESSATKTPNGISVQFHGAILGRAAG